MLLLLFFFFFCNLALVFCTYPVDSPAIASVAHLFNILSFLWYCYTSLRLLVNPYLLLNYPGTSFHPCRWFNCNWYYWWLIHHQVIFIYHFLFLIFQDALNLLIISYYLRNCLWWFSIFYMNNYMMEVHGQNLIYQLVGDHEE